MKDHSQNGEQAIILKYFGDFRGTLLDIGANDGLTFSNSRALVELGWNAVLVEPSETAFSKLLALYRNNKDGPFPCGEFVVRAVTCVQAAITTQDGPIDFYDSGTHLKKGDTSLLSTTRPEELARWRKSGEVFTKTTVRGITFKTLLKELYGFVDGHGVDSLYEHTFDFITIDAEGADYSILEQIDLTAVGCHLLCVEVNRRGDAEFTAYAKRHGMRLLWSSFENRIYAR